MPIKISLIAAILPISAYLLFLWQADKFEKESFHDILIHFAWGGIGAIGISLIFEKLTSGGLLVFLHNSHNVKLFQSIFSAPIIEESSKAIFLFYTIKTKKIDDITDGLVYGGSIGLGFGMVENFFYYVVFYTNPIQWIYLVIIRSFFSAVMHFISTGTLGAFIAKSLYSKQTSKTSLYLAGLFIAVSIHFMWNLSVSTDNSFYLGLLLIFVLLWVFIIYFAKQITKERQVILRELKEECDEGIIPFHFLPILAGSFRNRNGWIDKNIRKEYVRTAIKLAFRKNQLKICTGDIDYYKNEIAYCKNKLIELNLNRN